MLLSMSQAGQLQALRVPVAGPKGRPRAAELDAVRQGAIERLRAAAVAEGIVPAPPAILAADVVLQPGREGQRLWMGSWLPARLATELDGGPKDGAMVAMPSLRAVLEYRQLAPSWAAAAAAGYPLPKVSYRYHLAGYDSARGVYVHRYLEEV